MTTDINTLLRNWVLWLLPAIVWAGCASSTPPVASSVSGTATYRERVALPPGAVFEATLEDLSRADAPSTVIGSSRVDSPKVPIAFAISYVLRVERYVAISAQSQCDSTAGAASLENTYWKLLTMRGKPVAMAEKQREPHVILQPAQKRVAGSSGCNRLVGSYTLDGDRLTFGRSAGTRMACPQGMDQERAFLDLLPAVARWRINGQRLQLLDERGAVLAEFESV